MIIGVNFITIIKIQLMDLTKTTLLNKSNVNWVEDRLN